MNFWPFKKKHAPRKPRIVKRGADYWCCGVGMFLYGDVDWLVCDGPMGSGSTPAEAYRDWKREVDAEAA